MIELIVTLIVSFGFTPYFKTVAKQKQKRGLTRLGEDIMK